MLLTAPRISIQKQNSGCKIAVFDHPFTLVRDFVDYSEEAKGIQEAKDWIKQFSDVEPEIVRPQITKMKLTFKARKR